MDDISGKVVWVTGAGTGIGRAIAVAFARAGCRVAITGRREGVLAETAELMGGGALVVAADVTEPAGVERAHGAVVAGLGAVEILVNNAGSNVARRHWRELSAGDMGEVVDVNLKGPFLCTLAVLPGMRAAGGGTVIHVVSNASMGIFAVGGPSYTAAKHGARALSGTLNAEEGIHGIRSVCINPGEVETPILDKRPKPVSAADRALMVQPVDIAEGALFAARMPARSCVAELLIVPTDNRFHRETARRLAGEA